MSDVDTSDSDEDFDNEDIIVIKAFAVKKGASSSAGPAGRFQLGQSDELDARMDSLTQRIDECQAVMKERVTKHIIDWLQRVTKAPSALNSRKLPVFWVYSGTIHSIEVNQVLWDLSTSARKEAGNLVLLTPEDMGIPKASNKLAKMIYSQLSDTSVPPGSHFTLQHVAALCAEKMRQAPRSQKSGTARDPPQAPVLLLVLPDIDITAQRPLQQLMHALSDLRQAGELRPALVVGAARHPDVVRPLLSAEGARAHAYMRPEAYKLPSSMHSLGSLVQHTQVNLELPEVLLGPHALTCLSRVISRTGLCQGSHMLSQALRLSLLRHFMHNPTAAVGAAVCDGDWPLVKRRLDALPRAVAQRLAEEAEELPGGGDGDVEREGRSKKPTRKSKKESPKTKPTIRALKSLRQAVLTWQLSLQWLHLAAAATAHASTLRPKPAQELAWWPLVAGASAPGYMKPGNTPGFGSGPAAAERRGAVWPASLRSTQARQRAACFGDGATARATKQCFSAVTQLQEEAAVELAREIAAVADSCEEAGEGALSPHVAAIAALVAQADGVDESDEEEDTAHDSSDSEAAGSEEEPAVAAASDSEEGGSEEGGSQEEGQPAGERRQKAAAASAAPRTRRRGAAERERRSRRDARAENGSESEGGAAASGSDADASDSAENENGPSCHRTGNGGSGGRTRRSCRVGHEELAQKSRKGRGAATRSARVTCDAEEEQPRSARAQRRQSSAAAAGATLRGAAEERQALAPLGAGVADDEGPEGLEGVAEAPRRPTVRRGHRQTNGQFLVQQAERAAARAQGSAGDGTGAGASGSRDTVAWRLAHVLQDAWLTALQAHPSQHPCACVLYVDDGDDLLSTLAPSPRHDLHQVLMDPAPQLNLKKGVHPPIGLTFMCTAYQLLAQYGRNVDVGDWFASFCLALGAPATADAEDGAAGGRGKKRRRAPKKRRKMKTVERSVPGAADVGGDGADAEDKRAGGGVQCVIDLERAGDSMHELYVYFYQAVKQLMYYGVLKRCNRRTGGFWKREIFPPDGCIVYP